MQTSPLNEFSPVHIKKDGHEMVLLNLIEYKKMAAVCEKARIAECLRESADAREKGAKCIPIETVFSKLRKNNAKL